MPSELHLSDVDDGMIDRLRARARENRRSIDAEHREILSAALSGDNEVLFEELAAELRRLTAIRRQTPSEFLLRESRDEN